MILVSCMVVLWFGVLFGVSLQSRLAMSPGFRFLDRLISKAHYRIFPGLFRGDVLCIPGLLLSGRFIRHRYLNSLNITQQNLAISVV